jgi:hypothetical protein
VHLVLFPLTFVCFAVGPYVAALARDFIHLEVAKVHASISESKGASAMLLAFVVLSIVLRIVRPSLNSASMLLIVKPLTYICCTVSMGVGTLAVCLVVPPLTFVNITIGMD